MNCVQALTPGNWFETAHHLAQHCPYTCNGPAGPFFLTIGEALASHAPRPHRIDPVGIVEVLTKGYPLAERTLVAGVQRTPWMGRPAASTEWAFSPLPEHGIGRLPVAEAVTELHDRLISEALTYLHGRSRVGILLSGGLDSRIAAGILRTVQLSGEYPGTVTVLTWGLHGTRDVVYAGIIADRYGWECRHLPLGPDQLRSNIRVAGEMGAEFAPFHLHAMAEVARCVDLDAVIAGSYGDSVGRAEYSGARVMNLQRFIPQRLDPFGLIRPDVLAACRAAVSEDAYGYRSRVARTEEFQYREIEQQMHYMRRRNQACMSLIAARIPLYQMFTAPATFGFMWGLDPASRTDQYYQGLLPRLPGQLDKIPWARTGRPLGQAQGAMDSLARLHHQYGLWLRRDLRDEIISLIFDGSLQRLGVFNEHALRWLMRLWERPRTHSVNLLDEAVGWLASLAVFTARYEIEGCDRDRRSAGLNLAAVRGVARAAAYLVAREQMRR